MFESLGAGNAHTTVDWSQLDIYNVTDSHSLCSSVYETSAGDPAIDTVIDLGVDQNQDVDRNDVLQLQYAETSGTPKQLNGAVIALEWAPAVISDVNVNLNTLTGLLAAQVDYDVTSPPVDVDMQIQAVGNSGTFVTTCLAGATLAAIRLGT